MFMYSLKMVRETLEEVCKKFAMTQSLNIKKIKFLKQQRFYLITLGNDSQRTIQPELIKKYIESFGDEGGLEIAGHLMHPIDLEQSAFSIGSSTDETWDGDMRDVIDYLKKKEEAEGTADEEDDYQPPSPFTQ